MTAYLTTLRSHLPTVLAVGPVLGALRLSDPPAWRRAVRSVLRDAGGLSLAAEALGVPRRTLERWIADEPGLARGADLPGRGRPKLP